MSLQSELDAVSKRYFDPKLRSQVYEASPFWKRLYKKGKVITDGGKDLQWSIRYRKYGLSGDQGMKEEIEFIGKDTRTYATDDWTTYTTQATVHLDEKVKNQGQGKIIDLAKDKAKEMEEDLRDQLYTDLWATSSVSGKMTPMYTIVDSADTYGGIAVADASEWASTEDSSTTTLVLTGSGSLSYMVNQATFGDNGPTVHYTTRDLVSKYESLLQGQVRYTPDNDLDYGADTYFKGKPVYGDAFIASGDWFGIDENQFEIRVMKGYDIDISDWFTLEQRGFPWAVAKVGIWIGNMLCRMRKTSFKFTALDYTK